MTTTGLSQKMLTKLEAYKADANQCTLLKYIFNESDLNDDNEQSVFRPEYTHQIFGDDELIFGFKKLKVNYYLTPGLMHAYIGLQYAEKITPQRFDGIEPDDVYDSFQKFGCSPGFTRNLDLFCSDKLKQDMEFRPFGTKIHEYSRYADANQMKYEVYKVDLSCNEYHSQKFVDYLQRVQTMLIFFIETADFTDTDDEDWVYYFLYEKRADNRYATIGFTSVYNYYAYPDKKRTRISQMLIMPTYQHGGHGAQLMECIYNDAVHNPEILDVTAEGPSTNFIKLRDYVTCVMCLQLSSFQNKDLLKKCFSGDMVAEALKRFKLPKLQTRRCYEILRLQVTNQNNASEWKDYRLDVKKRLFMPFIRNLRFARNAGNVANPNDVEAQTSGTTNGVANKKQPTDRFGFDAPSGTTTIGFGAPPQPQQQPAKGVRFSEQPTVLDSRFGGPASKSSTTQVGFKLQNASCSSNDDEDDGEDDDDEENQSENVSGNYGSLFMSEAERKIYLEKEFQETVADYRNTLKRLEGASYKN